MIIESQKSVNLCVKGDQSKSKSNFECNKNQKESGQARSAYLIIYFSQTAPISFYSVSLQSYYLVCKHIETHCNIV